MGENKKMYQEVIKVLGARLSDESETIVGAYSGIPKGHAIESSFTKGTLSSKIAELKKQKESGDDLLTSADSALAYAPSDVKRLYWQSDRPMGENLMVEMPIVELKVGANIKIDDKTYNFVRNAKWNTFGTNFVVVTPIELIETVDSKEKDEEETQIS